MKREIKFRGKTKFTGDIKTHNKWVCGFYHESPDGKFSYINNIPVIPETVGQYIGLKDQYGTEIYEKDIVEDTLNDPPNNWGIITLDPNKWEGEPFIYGNPDAFSYKGFLELISRHRIKIIGNTCDNPGLTGGIDYLSVGD